MSSSRMICTVILACSFSFQASAQDEAGRKAAQAKVIQHLENHLDMLPMAKWSDRDRSSLPGLLEEELESAKDRSDSMGVLAVIDCMDKFTRITPALLALKAQAAWTTGFLRDALDSAKKTPLADLFKALDRERRGEISSREKSTSEILRHNEYEIVSTYVDWTPFRTILLQGEVATILRSDSYLLQGEKPEGFLSEWFGITQGPYEKWDSAWETALKSRDLPLVMGLLKRMPNYKAEGLTQAQRDSLVSLEASDWGLPYLWARTLKTDKFIEFFRPGFALHVKAARFLANRQLVEAEETFRQTAMTPRDRYELSLLQESLGTESALSEVVSHANDLRQDPHVPGWTDEQAQSRLTMIQGRLNQITSTRLASERAAAAADAAARKEAARQEAAARQAAARQAALAKQAAARDAEAAKAASAARSERSAAWEGLLASLRHEFGVGQSKVYRAQELNAIYQENEVSADERFKGRAVEIQCTVGEISKDFTDSIYLVIPTGQFLQDIHAYFDDSDKALIATLRRGDRVRLFGKVNGMIMKSIILKRCKIAIAPKGE